MGVVCTPPLEGCTVLLPMYSCFVMEFEANGPIQLFENEVNTSVREYVFYVFFSKSKNVTIRFFALLNTFSRTVVNTCKARNRAWIMETFIGGILVVSFNLRPPLQLTRCGCTWRCLSPYCPKPSLFRTRAASRTCRLWVFKEVHLTTSFLETMFKTVHWWHRNIFLRQTLPTIYDPLRKEL